MKQISKAGPSLVAAATSSETAFFGGTLLTPIPRPGNTRTGHPRVVDQVVERGLTAICVAGTLPALGAVFRQPGSEPGTQAGSLRSICCLSVSVVVSM